MPRPRNPTTVLTLAALAVAASCATSSETRWGYLHAGDVRAVNVLGGDGRVTDAIDDITFSQCLVEILSRRDDVIVVGIGSAKNVAMLFELHCGGDGGACVGESSAGTLRAGLFRLDGGEPGAVMDLLRSLATEGHAHAAFGDPRCMAMEGTVELVLEGERITRARFSLESRGGSGGSRPTTITGEIFEYRQRLDPGGSLL